MKKLILTCMVIASFYVSAQAETMVCIAGQAEADGRLTVLSQNPVKVLIFKDGSVTPYNLAGEASTLFNTNYNMNQPFNMNLIVQNGHAGSYTTTDNKVAAKWKWIDAEPLVGKAEVSIDITSQTGNFSEDRFENGKWAGTTMDKFICTLAGTVQ